MKSIYEFLLKSKTVASTQDADYVDLGLPSGLLWAKCNIGAEKPYEYGDYFMWGSTEPDTDKPCDWEHAPFNGGCEDINIPRFYAHRNKACPNGILVPEYDAATVILGDEWRMPTADEFKELIDNTEQEWVKNYQDSKINGILFKANSNEKYAELFIPAAGCRNESMFYNRGSSTYLWSSSINASSSIYARRLAFNSSSHNTYYACRYYGFCMRGVKEN